MAFKKSAVPFSGTPEQEEKLRKIIAEHKNDPGALMPILQQAQEIYGYLPIEVQTIIAEEMDISLEKVYGVVTFYAKKIRRYSKPAVTIILPSILPVMLPIPPKTIINRKL